MYLAEHTINGRKKFVIRDSRYNAEADCWQSRDLYDLGSSPWEYIEYPGGNAFYITESVSLQLAAKGVDPDSSELEELFWPFIRSDIRLKIEPFHCRGTVRNRKRGELKKNAEGGKVQIFDKRRMYYLRCGVVDQRSVEQLPLRYFSPLLNKSRDEAEQYILQLEKNIHPREYKLYVYVIFDLQRYFRASPARSIPQALDQEELDRYFVKDLCSLHLDGIFWAGFHKTETLHEYLSRYAVMFFDNEFDGSSAWNEYMREFINSKRFHRTAPAPKTVPQKEILEIFGVSAEVLKKMSKNELTRLFRQKALELHPDKGGKHDDFVRLAEAYKQLLSTKR